MHIASNKNLREIAIFLIERGINTIATNQQKLTALDLAKTKEMKEIVGYIPFNNRKYQGYLLRKRKFLGFKEYFVVLNKGYMIYYSNEYVFKQIKISPKILLAEQIFLLKYIIKLFI